MLKPCPDSPNCVCSMHSDDKKHFIEPILPKENISEVRLAIEKFLKSDGNISIAQSTQEYIHAAFKVPFTSFIDDVEFYFPSNENIVHVRSASRKGYSDLGVNKARVNRLKKFLKKEGVI